MRRTDLRNAIAYWLIFIAVMLILVLTTHLR